MQKTNKKGQVEIGITLVTTILGLIILGFAALYAVSILQPGSFFTANSLEQNATNDAVRNYTAGYGNLTARIPTMFTLGAAVILLSLVGVLLVVIYRSIVSNKSGGLG